MTSAGNDRVTGWMFVGVQFVLFGVLVLLPNRDDWPVAEWVQTGSRVLILIGIAISAVGAIGLGQSFTATPVPKEQGQLQTGGLYRWSRHPIYSGVLLIIVGLVIGSGSLLTACVGLVTAAFFNTKAAWEEKRLGEQYDGYETYASSTNRFWPKFGTSNDVEPLG